MKPPQAKSENHYLYTKKYKFRARKLRNSMTRAEKALWQMIRRKSIHGYTFNRQRPVLFYIADFMCKRLKLIIEVDGSIHDLLEQREKDARRDKVLQEAGFSVLRFKNWEVLYDPAGVYNDIKRWVEASEDFRRGTDFSSPRPPS